VIDVGGGLCVNTPIITGNGVLLAGAQPVPHGTGCGV